MDPDIPARHQQAGRPIEEARVDPDIPSGHTTVTTPPPPRHRRRWLNSRRRTSWVATSSGVSVPAPSASLDIDFYYPRRETFSISGRFGAGYGCISESGLYNVGLGLGYTLDPRIQLDFRTDFQLAMNEEGAASELSSIWMALNMVLYLNRQGIVQPYALIGVLMAIAPGNRDHDIPGFVGGGGQAGFGLEVLIRQVVGISLEVVGFVAGHSEAMLEGGVLVNTALTWYI